MVLKESDIGTAQAKSRAGCQRSRGNARRRDLSRGDRRVEASGARQNLADRRGEFIHAGARDDDGIPAAVSFFGDPQKLSAIVLAEFEMKMLPLDLKLLSPR